MTLYQRIKQWFSRLFNRNANKETKLPLPDCVTFLGSVKTFKDLPAAETLSPGDMYLVQDECLLYLVQNNGKYALPGMLVPHYSAHPSFVTSNPEVSRTIVRNNNSDMLVAAAIMNGFPNNLSAAPERTESYTPPAPSNDRSESTRWSDSDSSTSSWGDSGTSSFD